MRLLKFAFLLLAWMMAAVAHAQVFPSQTVRLVVPYPAGGALDILARSLAADLAKTWGQPVVVENVAGAASIIGTERVVKAAPDGHTLLFTTNPTVVGNRFLYKSLPFDPDRQLTPITMVAKSGQLIVAHPSLKANTLRELVEAAKREPGRISYGSYGNGTQPNLLLEMVKNREGVDLLHVPYKGIAPAILAITSGEVQLTVSSPAGVLNSIKAGKLKALAIADAKRARDLPSVPTTAEAGFPYATASVWFGLFAPAGTPQAAVDRIARDVATVAKRPDFLDAQILARGLDLVANTPAEFRLAIAEEVAGTAEMVKSAKIQPE